LVLAPKVPYEKVIVLHPVFLVVFRGDLQAAAQKTVPVQPKHDARLDRLSDHEARAHVAHARTREVVNLTGVGKHFVFLPAHDRLMRLPPPAHDRPPRLSGVGSGASLPAFSMIAPTCSVALRSGSSNRCA